MDKLAKKLLDENWDYGWLPINPSLIANRLGISVEVSEDEPCCKYIEDGQTKKIVCSKNQPASRRRFMIAHSLFFAASKLGPRANSFDDYRKSAGGVELLANHFVASLLVPDDYISALVVKNGYTSFEKIREAFDVSSFLIITALRRTNLY